MGVRQESSWVFKYSELLPVAFIVIEVSGEPRDDKAAKVGTIRKLWVPAVNNSGQFGRWDYIEIKDPYQA